ncbi:nucleotidyltransferase family protein [Paenibacillus thalictri]|uniref:nucleotidyltransferase family protein n=1 Tax=Paenibacillus thalictri TaxID=2527873 RepID=UPI001F0F907A|nr:nucleotidyltransferase family protein [Paenibacillus thalictri]
MSEQLDALTKMIARNELLDEVLRKSPELGLDQYYIGAGCIAQTVWNTLSGRPPHHGIKDIDWVYFDEDVSAAAEERMICRVQDLFHHLPVELDVKNQARVHLWYKQHFGYDIVPYASLEAAIRTWPTTATAIGVRKQRDGWNIYAPFGLDDLLGKVVKANKKQITKDIYEGKVARWIQIWPDLQIIPWE